MVSMGGAKAAQSLIPKIDALQVAIDNVSTAIKAGATMWQMAASVYIPTGPQGARISSTLGPMNYDMSASDTAAILNAVLTALQNQLTVVQEELNAIT